jgi:hypothetical protein
MKKMDTNEDISENGDVASVLQTYVSEETAVTVLPNIDSKRTYKVMSPRLAHKNQAKDFVHEVIEEAPDATL